MFSEGSKANAPWPPVARAFVLVARCGDLCPAEGNLPRARDEACPQMRGLPVGLPVEGAYAPISGGPKRRVPSREASEGSQLPEMSDLQRREFHEALLVAGTFEDLPGKWQAAILKPEENRPNLRIVRSG
jgi:hypothetical protein